MNMAMLTKRVRESGKTISSVERKALLQEAHIIDKSGQLDRRFFNEVALNAETTALTKKTFGR